MKCLNADVVDLLPKPAYDFAAAMCSAQGKQLADSLNGVHLKLKFKRVYSNVYESTSSCGTGKDT
jgi:hypothetical protein